MQIEADFDLEKLIYSNVPVGTILRLRREYFSLSLPEMEKALNIRSEMLNAIERNDFSCIPGQTYIIGFIRTYAQYLELDANKIVNIYKSGTEKDHLKKLVESAPAVSDNNTPKLYLVALSFLVFVISVIFFSHQNTPLTVAPLPQKEALTLKKDGNTDNFPLNQSSQKSPSSTERSETP